MTSTEAHKRASIKSRKKIYDSITFISRRDDKLREQINYASCMKNKSKNQYIIDAINTQLELDGISIDSLPDKQIQPQAEIKEPKQCMCYLITMFYAEPDKYKEAPNRFWFDEEYVTVVGTLPAARKYILSKFPKKAYPERYHYVIYGRYIEAFSKLEAVNKYKSIAYKAIENYQKELDKALDVPDEVGVRIKTFIGFMNDYSKPEYVEVVDYDEENY